MSRKPTEPLPGTEQDFILEGSVQSRYLDQWGREIPNPTPLAPPVGYIKQPSIAEQMRMMIRQASYEASQLGAETEDEANDFDVGEDLEPSSPWEHDFEVDPTMEALLALQSSHPNVAPAAPVVPPVQRSEGGSPPSVPETPAT